MKSFTYHLYCIIDEQISVEQYIADYCFVLLQWLLGKRNEWYVGNMGRGSLYISLVHFKCPHKWDTLVEYL